MTIYVVLDLQRRTPDGQAWRVATFRRLRAAEAWVGSAVASRPGLTIVPVTATRRDMELCRD